MNLDKREALDRLIIKAFTSGTYSYADVQPDVALLMDTPVWNGDWTFTQDEIDNGISHEVIKGYILKSTIYQAYNL